MVRVVAILAGYNEERFIESCLEHYIRHGVDVYLIDNDSTDDTVKLAQPYLGRGLLQIETFRRRGRFEWINLLARKEDISFELDADWVMHADPDERRLPPTSDKTLAESITEVDEQGYNAINFMEFTFVPTVESPDHDHPDFERSMTSYYPFCPSYPNRLNAWKKQAAPPNAVSNSSVFHQTSRRAEAAILLRSQPVRRAPC